MSARDHQHDLLERDRLLATLAVLDRYFPKPGTPERERFVSKVRSDPELAALRKIGGAAFTQGNVVDLDIYRRLRGAIRWAKETAPPRADYPNAPPAA